MLEAGQELTEGPVNPHDILKIKGIKGVQQYLLREVQAVYRLQGVEINDKHIEVIVRQMLRKVKVEKRGRYGSAAGRNGGCATALKKENEKAILEGGQTASAKYVLMGITKASLATDSLPFGGLLPGNDPRTDRSGHQRQDAIRSLGLKENVIIGKLIPAGTGLSAYRDIEIKKESTRDYSRTDPVMTTKMNRRCLSMT